MNNKEFSYVIKEQIDMCRSLLLSKGEEYSTDTDRLENFKRCAALQGLTPEQALSGQMTKHTVSVQTMIWDPRGVTHFTLDKWSEKITDHINYLLLLKAIVVEAHNEA